MNRTTGSDTMPTGKGRKVGAGVKPTGVFSRIAAAEKKSGMTKIIRHTQPENLRK